MCSNARGSASKQWVRQFVVVIIYLSAVFLLSVPIASCITLNELYPFNVSKDGDLRTDQKDDGGSPLIKLDMDFPFYNISYRELYVNNNGIISFLDKLETYKPQNFIKFENKVPMIAPYWADIDIENVNTGNFNESVVYRIIYNDSVILNRATDEIKDNFVSASTFSAELVIIVTWYNVGFYGASGEKTGKGLRNTFQAVLVTDSYQSYAIYNYEKISWTTGSNSGGETETGVGGEPAVVGFHSGRNDSVYNIDVSGTAAVINITQTSNVNHPGVWIFRIDGPVINDLGCRTSSDIEVNPRYISMLGRKRLLVKGPCLSTYSQPKARFSFSEEIPSLEFNCSYVDEITAICVAPSVFWTGEIKLEFAPDGKEYRFATTIFLIHLSDFYPNLIRDKPDDWLVGKMVTIDWEPATIFEEEAAYFLEVLGYHLTEEDSPTFTPIQRLEVTPESGTRKFKLLTPGSSYNTLIARLCWSSNTHPSTLPLCIWSDVFPVRWKKEKSKESQDWCENWIIREKTLIEEKTLSPVVVSAPNCSCILTIAENDLGHFHVDPYCDKTKSSSGLNCLYNSKAQQCMRRNFRSATNFPGVTCCYDKRGELMDIRANPGAGTHQRYHNRAQGGSVVPFFSYFESDLLPKLHCCQFSETNCSDFLTLRHPTTCAGYTPPSPAQAAGDPHLVTLDGKGYSFNGVGDFILVQDINSTVVIQVRAEQASDVDGNPQKATVFTGVAVSAGSSSDIVELRKKINGSGAEVLVNGDIVTIDTTTSQFKSISLQKNSTNEGSYLIVLAPVSVSVTIEVTPDLLNIIVLIGEESLKGRLQGLLGNYNGIADDDFTARDGKVVSATASERLVHYDFGMTWEVTPEESLLSRSEKYDSQYEPVFIDEILSLENLPPETTEICGKNKQCQFDYHVTRKESVAKSTVAFTNKFEALREELEKKVIRCPFLNPPENGNRSVPSYSNGSVATFTCNPGFEMTFGEPERYCQDDSTWSGGDVVCAIKTHEEQDSYVVYIIAGSSAASLAVVVIIVCGVILIYRHMRRRKSESERHNSIEDIELMNIPVFTNPVFLETLHSLTKDGRFRIPRPDFVDPNIFQEYF